MRSLTVSTYPHSNGRTRGVHLYRHIRSVSWKSVAGAVGNKQVTSLSVKSGTRGAAQFDQNLFLHFPKYYGGLSKPARVAGSSDDISTS
jgi:hypothetical protein